MDFDDLGGGVAAYVSSVLCMMKVQFRWSESVESIDGAFDWVERSVTGVSGWIDWGGDAKKYSDKLGW